MTSRPVDLTFVFPCLNEERFIGHCIERVRTALGDSGISYEVVVADNGSSDRSAEIAGSMGARVVPVPRRGYGAALKAGIEAAAGRYAMFADSDGTYLYEHAPALFQAAVKCDADMAIASRMTGTIQPGAMPPLHRWLGTPVLTWLINRLFHGRLTDCNSGFRCLKPESFRAWRIRADGMEFASELLIKALKAEARMVEIPSGLTVPPSHREAHLKTWRDGMRHLLFILAEKPRLFELTGLVLLSVTSVLQVCALALGPTIIGPLHVFDVHSQALLLMVAALGAQLYTFSAVMYLRSGDAPLNVTRRLINMDEGVLFALLAGLVGGMGLVMAGLIVVWASSHFQGLHSARELLGIVHFLSIGLAGSLGLLGLHVLKKGGH